MLRLLAVAAVFADDMVWRFRQHRTLSQISVPAGQEKLVGNQQLRAFPAGNVPLTGEEGLRRSRKWALTGEAGLRGPGKWAPTGDRRPVGGPGDLADRKAMAAAAPGSLAERRNGRRRPPGSLADAGNVYRGSLGVFGGAGFPADDPATSQGDGNRAEASGLTVFPLPPESPPAKADKRSGPLSSAVDDFPPKSRDSAKSRPPPEPFFS